MKEHIAVSMAGLMLLTAGYENSDGKFSIQTLAANMKSSKTSKAPPQEVGEKNIYGQWQGKSNPSRYRGGLFLRGDFIYWRADVEGLQYAAQSTDAVSTPSITHHILEPKVEWSPGFRVGVGYTFSHQDFWDIMALWTHFKTHHCDTQSVNPKHPSQIVPWWGATLLGDSVNSASVHWNLTYNTYDLDLGRSYFVAKTFSVHPFVGLRGATIQQQYHAHYSLVPRPTSLRADTDFWGIGAHIGTALQWRCNRAFSLCGSVGGSLLYADFTTEEKYKAIVAQNPTTLTPLSIHDHATTGAFNIDAMVGVQWEQFFYKNKYRLSILMGYEWSEWFSQNRLTKLDISGSNHQYEKASGNLTLQGANLQARWDF